MRLAIAILGASAATAHANPADIFGLGARGASMANAQVANVDDSTATYYNPALLASFDEIHIDVGYQVASPNVSANGERFHVDRSEGIAAGIAVPGRIAGKRLAIGASMFLPDQQVTRTRTLPFDRPRFLAYDNRPQRLLLAAVGAFEIMPGLQIGAGVAYMASTNGTVELQGLIGFPNPAVSDLDLAIDVDVRTIRYPHAGIAWRALPWLELGVSYRGGFRLVIDQTVKVRGNIGTPDATVIEDGHLDLRSVSQDLFQPMQITAGAAANLGEHWLVALDLSYQRWSVYDNPTANVEIELDIKQFNELVTIPPARILEIPNLHDIVVPRLGVEWTQPGVRTWSVRGGYGYERAVAPEQRGESNFIDNDKHTLSAGGGVQWRGIGGVIQRPVSLDAYVAFTYLIPREHHKTSPVDPVGDYTARGHTIAAGVMSRWRF
ncbi:MAG: outer membrane protein transport protein [Kofleriaceae bacterium]